MAEFRNQAQCHHLTYKGHVDMTKWQLHFYPLHEEPKRFSFVHESSDTENAYDHTHIFVEWRKNFDSRNARVFDFEDIHPHILNVQSLKHKKSIVLKYHWKAPVGPLSEPKPAPYQVGCGEWELQQEAWLLAELAPSVKDACLSLGISPNSINDVEKVLQLSKKRKFTEVAEGVDKTRFKSLDWDRTKALVLRGPPAIGKTQWALSQFNSPVMVEDIDELKDLPVGCDGLVFDEVQFDMLAKAKKIALTDWEMPRTLRIRHSLARIPRHMPKIFCCNEHEHTFGQDSHGSVLRRIQTIDVVKKDLLRGP